jgi:hypothetical protein
MRTRRPAKRRPSTHRTQRHLTTHPYLDSMATPGSCAWTTSTGGTCHLPAANRVHTVEHASETGERQPDWKELAAGVRAA